MSEERPPGAVRPFPDRTARAPSLQTPLRVFLSTNALLMPDLVRHAGETCIAPARFSARLASRVDAARVAEDVDSADLSGVSGTPTFFINGRRHHGGYDIAELTEAVRAAKAASLASAGPTAPRR